MESTKVQSSSTVLTDNSSPQSATNSALSNWIILARILDVIRADEGGSWPDCPIKGTDVDPDKDCPDNHYCDGCTSYMCLGVLFRCSLVNRFWSQEATKKLWKRPYLYPWDQGTTLTCLLAWRRNGARRQYYANLIEEGSERTYDERLPDGSIIEGILFPKMKTLYLSLDYRGHVPRLQGAAVEKLVLDPHYESCNPETWFVDQDTLDTILDELAVIFPNVKEIEFVDQALAWPGAVQRFAKRMSRLEIFDYSLVLETSQRTETGGLV